jgi:hypothetical protein
MTLGIIPIPIFNDAFMLHFFRQNILPKYTIKDGLWY